MVNRKIRLSSENVRPDEEGIATVKGWGDWVIGGREIRPELGKWRSGIQWS